VFVIKEKNAMAQAWIAQQTRLSQLALIAEHVKNVMEVVVAM
jgi:hypothetical protein